MANVYDLARIAFLVCAYCVCGATGIDVELRQG